MKILFIGNSHTYVNDLPQLCRLILEKNGINAHVTMLAHPGMGFDYHGEQPQVRFNILFGDYDYIVLQHDAHPFRGEKVLVENGLRLFEFIQKTKSKPILYMTWSEKINPQGQDEVAKAYYELAKKTGAIVAPVGLVWQKHKKESDIELYGTDGEHASLDGSWLGAYTIACAVINKHPDVCNKDDEIKSKIAWECFSEQ